MPEEAGTKCIWINVHGSLESGFFFQMFFAWAHVNHPMVNRSRLALITRMPKETNRLPGYVPAGDHPVSTWCPCLPTYAVDDMDDGRIEFLNGARCDPWNPCQTCWVMNILDKTLCFFNYHGVSALPSGNLTWGWKIPRWDMELHGST